MNDNDKKVREYLEQPEVPEELSPENIKNMLDEKAPAKKRRSRVTFASRLTAVAAACAVIAGCTFGASKIFVSRDNQPAVSGDSKHSSTGGSKPAGEAASDEEPADVVVVSPEQKNSAYMTGAQNYEQIYKLLEKSDKKHKDIYYDMETNGFDIADETVSSAETADGAVMGGGGGGGGYGSSDDDPYYIPEVPEPTEAPTETATEEVTEAPTEPETTAAEPTEPTTDPTEPTTEEPTDADEGEEHSDTHNQEENVLEADIVKTDGKCIYYIYNSGYYEYDSEGYSSQFYSNAVMNIAEVSKGEFGEHTTLTLDPDVYSEDDGWDKECHIQDMYLYDDMIAVIGTVSASKYKSGFDKYDGNYLYDRSYYAYESENETFVSFYTKGTAPELIGTYRQDGWYSDVRIAPDGYMYLVSNFNSASFDCIDDAEDIEKYIPQCGVNEVECLSPDDILLPADDLDNVDVLSYTIIGSIDLNTAGEFALCETKALAGYSGNLYSSANNMYAATGWEQTYITRIAIGGGSIVPAASCTVEGHVNDQFSMSEYNGYFRVATTINTWKDNSNFITDLFDIPTDYEHIHENCLYVLDMDLNEVGKVTGFGEDENIKSVRFSGNMAYVVTFMQTDPLFAIDMNDPSNPFITDEFKITGYSTYMEKWDDDHLLGFGVEADERGVRSGLKLVMFDSSDPYDLKEVGYQLISGGEDDWYYSEALYDRKALLIAPEKNLIGVPVDAEHYDDETCYYVQSVGYHFFSYADGEFTKIGESMTEFTDYDCYGQPGDIYFRRAVYVGDYVYMLSGDAFLSFDMGSFEQCDEIRFY